MSENKPTTAPKTGTPETGDKISNDASSLTAIKDAIKGDAVVTEIQPLQIGAVHRLKAVHGDLLNPFSLYLHEVDKSSKVEVDSWTNMQYVNGKLVKDED